MNQWAALEAQMDVTKTANPSGFLAYMQINGTLVACGKPVAATVPGSPAPPAGLPPLALQSTLAPFTLVVQSAAYAGLVQVYATKPTSAGRNSFTDSDYRLIGTLSALTAGSTPLTALYTALFPAPTAGQKTAVRLYPVSAQGFRGSPIVAAASLSATQATAADETPALKAA